MRFQRALFAALGLGLLASGCRAASHPEATDPDLASIRIINDVGAQLALEQVVIAIDGISIPVTALPPAGTRDPAMTLVHMSRGDHVLSVRASARSRDGSVSVVGAQQGLHVTGLAHVTILVRQQNDGVSGPFALEVAADGAALGPSLDKPASDDPDARCAGHSPDKLALCRTAASLDAALGDRDVVRTACIQARLDRMRALSEIIDSAKPHDADVAGLAEKQLLALAHMAEGCVAATPFDEPPVEFASPEGVSVMRGNVGSR
jgi:hypothetical protein